jgi:hypothetical protein
MNASGTSGLLGAIADRFDQIPVRGKLMTTLVSVIALVALAATNAHAIHLVGKPQHGYTVVEFVPTLPRPKFRAGMRLSLTGTKVLDLQHGDHKTTGWVEMHPVFEWKDIGDQPGDQVNVPKLAPPTEEGG